MTKTNRIPVSPKKIIKRLRAFTNNLEAATKDYESGNEVAYLTILQNTRSLMGKGTGNQIGVIPSAMEKFNVQGFNFTHNETGEVKTWEDFIERRTVTLECKPYRNEDFIWDYGTDKLTLRHGLKLHNVAIYTQNHVANPHSSRFIAFNGLLHCHISRKH